MAQVKIYGIREYLDPIKARLSDVIHSCVVDALSFPQDKWAHRFFPLEAEDFYYPAERTPRYTIVEISMFEGRLVETKKTLIRLLFEKVQSELDLAPADLKVTNMETPKHNWGLAANRETRSALTIRSRSDRRIPVEWSGPAGRCLIRALLELPGERIYRGRANEQAATNRARCSEQRAIAGARASGRRL